MDADDFWISNAVTNELMNAVMVLENADIIAFGSTSCNQNKERFSTPIIYSELYRDGGREVIWEIAGSFSANFYSLCLLRKWAIRFQEGLKYCEDKIFQMQCSFFAQKVQFQSEILHVYRQNAGSAMQRARSVEAITYYLPIIEGWIESDDYINSWSHITGKYSDAGYILAGIYFVDMTLEHYKQWGSRKSIEKVLKEHPYYELMIQFHEPDVKKYQCKKRNLLKNHPVFFKLKYNIIGVIEFIAKILLRTKLVYEWRMKRKYPLLQMPSND